MSFLFRQGTTPLLISIPHNGSLIPEAVANTMTVDGRSSRDTDWFLDRLYDIDQTRDASMLVAEQSRYVIDLNRAQTDESLYPGQTTTGLIPESCFDGSPIYAEALPSATEIQRRITEVWQPYHTTIETELNRLVAEHGIAVLIEAHSIASHVPRLFEGRLPDFNFGTNHGETCADDLLNNVTSVLENQSEYSHVTNGRFVGGFITRNYGRPGKNLHSLQIELSQITYMDEPTLAWHDAKSAQVQIIFQEIFRVVNQWIKTKST